MPKANHFKLFNSFINDLRYQENMFVSVVNNHATIYYNWHEMLLSYNIRYEEFEAQFEADRYNWRKNIEKDIKKTFERQALNNIRMALRGVNLS